MGTLRDVMAKDPLTTDEETTIAVASAAMVQARVGSLLVSKRDDVVGILTERDVLRAAGSEGDLLATQVRDWMTRTPTTADADTSTADAITVMLDGGFRHLPVTQDDEIVGIVSLRDLIGEHFASPRSGVAAGDTAPATSPAPVHQRRARMHEATRALHRCSRPPSGDVAAWRAELATAVATIADVVAAHIDETEGPDGLYQELVRETGGRLSASVNRLRREHERSTELLGELQAAMRDEADPTTLRAAADRLFAQLEAHRHRGSDLLWQAYGVDTGVGD